MRLLSKLEVQSHRRAEEARLLARSEELGGLIREQERRLQSLKDGYEVEKERIGRLVDKLTNEAIRRASLITS